MNIENVKNSYGRCLGSPDFFDRFYDVFLKSNPKIPVLFSKTDFTEQKKLIRHGINLIIMYADGNIVGMSGLKRINETHNGSLNIDHSLYAYWKESLMQVIREYDERFDFRLENEWSEVLDKGISFITKGIHS